MTTQGLDKVIRLLFVLIFCCVSQIVKGQEFHEGQNEQIIPVIAELDSNFIRIIDRHLLVMKKRKRAIFKRKVLVLWILPVISSSDGIPSQLIDSIYEVNFFPDKNNLKRYNLIIYSANECYANSNIRRAASAFFYEYRRRHIYILSEYNIDFPKTGEERCLPICVSSEANELDEFGSWTTYIMTNSSISETRFYRFFDQYYQYEKSKVRK